MEILVEGEAKNQKIAQKCRAKFGPDEPVALASSIFSRILPEVFSGNSWNSKSSGPPASVCKASWSSNDSSLQRKMAEDSRNNLLSRLRRMSLASRDRRALERLVPSRRPRRRQRYPHRKRTNIQDHSLLHVTRMKSPLRIGDEVTVGHRVILHGCTVGNRVLLGMGSIVMDDAVIEDDCIVGAGAVVTQGRGFQRKPCGGIPAEVRPDIECPGTRISQKERRELCRGLDRVSFLRSRSKEIRR